MVRWGPSQSCFPSSRVYGREDAHPPRWLGRADRYGHGDCVSFHGASQSSEDLVMNRREFEASHKELLDQTPATCGVRTANASVHANGNENAHDQTSRWS
jgi:hypothetical protein